MTLTNEKIDRITGCTIDRITDGYAEMNNSRFCAVVSECDFEGSEFHRTNLSGNHFESSDMSGDHFEEVNLSGAEFDRCDLSGAAICDCKLDGMTINGIPVTKLLECYHNNKEKNVQKIEDFLNPSFVPRQILSAQTSSKGKEFLKMNKSVRKAIIAGNWKMNKTRPEAKALLEELKPLVKDVSGVEVVACVPFTNLETALAATAGTNIKIGAENCHFEKSGAFTGEISADMLAEMGVSYVVLGHSERRQYFGETDETVNKRTKAALAAGLIPIVCVGELLWERECGITEEVIARQIKLDFFGIPAEDVKKCVIAYEPVWAIGTGKTATAEQAEEVCAFIRAALAKLYGAQIAEGMTIQYGGSMNAKNAAELVAKPNVDGGLIGGASLKAADFTEIVKAAENG